MKKNRKIRILDLWMMMMMMMTIIISGQSNLTKGRMPPHMDSSVVFARLHQCAPHLIVLCRRTESTSQTPSRLVQPFYRVHGREYIYKELYLFPLKIAPSHRGICTPSNAWFLVYACMLAMDVLTHVRMGFVRMLYCPGIRRFACFMSFSSSGMQATFIAPVIIRHRYHTAYHPVVLHSPDL